MSYLSYYKKAYANRAALIADIWTRLVAMGWEKHDSLEKSITAPYTDVSVANDTITKVAHGLVDGENVLYTSTGTTIGGLTIGNFYFVVSAAADTFKLSLTQGGAAINITGQGTGNHTFAEGYRVYKTNAESADRIYQYMKIDWATANTITFTPYYYWNATTHAGLGKAYSGSAFTTAETGFFTWMYGSKDLVVIMNKISATYYRVIFGYVPKEMFPIRTTLTEAASSGINVAITVTDTAGFEAGANYQIMGASAEGRDAVTIGSITDSTHMVISSLPRNYGINSQIGYAPSLFGSTISTSFYITNFFSVVGTADCSSSGSLAISGAFIAIGSLDPDARINMYILQSMQFVGATNAGGYCDANILVPPLGVAEDVFYFTISDSGTAESGGANTLTDTDKAWTVDQWLNKVVVIIAGTGLGQVRKITANTATQLTVDENWETNPGSTSQYKIVAEAYRWLYNYYACKEGV